MNEPSSKKYSFIDIYQILSIDVVIGTIAIGCMAVKLLNVSANPYWWIILPLAVWSIYTTDHIIDSFKNKGNAIIVRHKFHYIHRKALLVIVIITTMICVVLSFAFFETVIIYYGLLLSMITALYFILIHVFKNKKTLLLQKEFIIAGIYTYGIFLAPLFWYGSIPSYSIIVMILIIFVLAWLEGIMVSWFDYDNDLKDGHTSFSVLKGKKFTRYFLIASHLILAIFTIILLMFVKNQVIFISLVITLIMNLILATIILLPTRFSQQNSYALLGEAVFFLPFLIALA